VSHPRLGELKLLGSPIRLSASRAGIEHPAPEKGQHTAKILADIGYSASEIAEFRAKRVAL